MTTKKSNRDFYIFCLISAMIVACYSNTFTTPWHFDDIPNITENHRIQINNIQPGTLWKTFFASPVSQEDLYRPIACFSFAINWYFGQNNPLGYHIVNLLIHIFTAFFLFKTILALLRSSYFKTYSTQDAHFIALLAAILWAINPIQTQAVTYIVQRMASMAAMFFIFATYNYIRARQIEKISHRVMHIILCSVFFLLALGCKENAITLVPSLLLIEYLFFKKIDTFSKTIYRLLIVANTCLLLAVVYYIIENNYLQSFTLPFRNRSFSLFERLLTQPSIILFYLSLILYPSPVRLSIDHSFPLSTSILTPWSTLPSIICILLLITLSLLLRKKIPLISFSILFFLINHLVESTIIPLELIFEHRNYLPSLFLFIPIASGLLNIIKHSINSSRLIYCTILIFIPLLLTTIGLGTYGRNQVWASEETLWTDAMNKAQHNTRPLNRLGNFYGFNKEKTPENFRIAISLLHKSLDLNYPNTDFKALALDSIGRLYANYGMNDEAINYYKKSLDLDKNSIISRGDLVDSLIKKGDLKKALEHTEILINSTNKNSRFLNIKTILLLWMGKPDEALDPIVKALISSNYNKEKYFYNLGVTLTRAGYFWQGKWFLKRAINYSPKDTWILFSLIENCILDGNSSEAKKYAIKLLEKNGLGLLKKRLQLLRSDYTAAPVDVDLITPIIIETSKEVIMDLESPPTEKYQ